MPWVAGRERPAPKEGRRAEVCARWRWRKVHGWAGGRSEPAPGAPVGLLGATFGIRLDRWALRWRFGPPQPTPLDITGVSPRSPQVLRLALPRTLSSLSRAFHGAVLEFRALSESLHSRVPPQAPHPSDHSPAAIAGLATGARSPAIADLATIAGDIKLAHSVFALPFAALAAFLAAKPSPGAAIEWPRFAGQLLLVILAMVLARTAAMLANRLIDHRLDRDNPRTAQRAIPAGRLSPKRAAMALGLFALLFMACCAGFLVFGNPWPLVLGLPVLAWICAYGYLKRFTALCHLYLGSSLAISPLCAAIAVDPAQLAQPTLWLLSAMVLCWVGGFDVIYALQDVEVDRRQGLFSMPSRWGVSRAMWVSRGLHLVAAASLWIAVLRDPRFAWPMVAAAAMVTAILAIEHLTVHRWGTSRLALSFFTLNGLISCVVGAVGVVEVLRA